MTELKATQKATQKTIYYLPFIDINLHKFIEFVTHQHDVECNQKYDKVYPYSLHLKSVAAQCESNIDLVKPFLKTEFKTIDGESVILSNNCVIAAGWAHDLIEDARITYNDVVEKSNVFIADMVYACTELRGKNRSERHGPEYIQGLKDNKLGLYVKLCDIISNVLFSISHNSGMYKKYKKEFPHLKKELYIEEYKVLFDTLEALLKLR